MKLKKIRQEAVFKDYIELNFAVRKLATDASESNVFKLCINSLYGRCLLSARNQFEIRFCASRESALEFINSPRLRDVQTFDKDLTIVLMTPKKGIPQSSIQGITFDSFEQTLLTQKLTKLSVRTIRSIGHRLYNMKVDKIALTDLDLARCYPLEDDKLFPTIFQPSSHWML